MAGCSDPDEQVPPPKVETVTAYGQTLDEDATPQQVAYVLLRSLADDVHAAQAKPPRKADQRTANMITWSLAAPSEIERRLLAGQRLLNKNAPEKSSLGVDRDKMIYEVANLWAPIVAYYVDSFDQDAAAAMARMRIHTPSGLTGTEVMYEVWPAPSEPDAARHETLLINLVKEKGTSGGGEFWRVARVSYLGHGARSTTQPAAVPTTRPAATQPIQ